MTPYAEIRRVEMAAQDVSRLLRQARTPRVRRSKLEEAEKIAASVASQSKDMAELAFLASQARSGLIEYPAIREAAQKAASGVAEQMTTARRERDERDLRAILTL